MHIWLVDAFTDRAYGGNPAGVMIVPDFFEEILCIKIASELSQVETAFVKILDEGYCHIRWFSPSREVKMCGHAMLAAAHVLWEEGYIKGEEVLFNSLSGPLTVSRSLNGLTLDLPIQQTGPLLDDHSFCEILKTEPLTVIKAGDDILVELSSPELVRELMVDPTQILRFDCRAVIVTSVGDKGYDFVSRLFAPRIGIPEDAVSGAAHCKLADYWQKKTGKKRFLAYQASQRGGELLLEIINDRVHVTGKAVTVMKGVWLF